MRDAGTWPDLRAPDAAARSCAPRPFSAADWSSHLSGELGRSVRVSFGRARRSVLVAREEGRVLAVRMNERFAEAPPEIRAATAAWLRSGKRAKRACRLLDEYVAVLCERLAADPHPLPAARPRGTAHDLSELGAELLATDLAGERFPLGAPRLTWGRRGRAGRQLQLGSFDPESNLVRLHPVLDQAAVPRSFVRYVLFHELLHATMPTARPEDGRAIHHPPAFRRRESAYPGYAAALRWQDANLRELLRSSRTGKPMKPRRHASGVAKAVQSWLFPELCSPSGDRQPAVPKARRRHDIRA
jgi:hypothetical protein